MATRTPEKIHPKSGNYAKSLNKTSIKPWGLALATIEAANGKRKSL